MEPVELISVASAAHALNINELLLQRLVEGHYVPAYRIGKSLMVNLAELG